jgi:HEAT repeat protein
VADLCAGSFHDRWDCARQVADLGPAALADLLQLLEDDRQDWETRWFAARALGDLHHPEVIPALMRTFGATTDDDLRQAIAAALSQIGAPAIAALGAQLSSATHRPVAVQALARIHHPDTVPLLVQAAVDDRPPVRAAVIDALSAYADPVALPVVRRGLEDEASPVRLAAIRGLLSLRPHLDSAQVVALVGPHLGDADTAVAQQAAYALGRLAATPAPLLARLRRSPLPPELEAALVQALLWQNTAAALDAALGAWTQLQPPTRLVLVQGLSSLGDGLQPQAAQALLGWLRALPAVPAHSALRRQMVLTLGQLAAPNLEPKLRSLLDDPDPAVGLHAEAALRQLQSRPSLPG